MDEYLFIALAKLKADRLKLGRQAHAESRPPQLRDDEPIDSHRHSARTYQFSRAADWREQS